ncbi:MAG TPA: PilT/PilU family type 4a pilus ATPase [Candidatus Baltobacteraceae bacterium]|nr:PilT/PilU family type 4a pilus ATPase [Candidatus Baltobacteraceae bacterium]
MNATIPHIRLADVLHAARKHDASDVHFVPGLSPALRVDGDLQILPGSPLSSIDTSEIARSLFPPDAIARLESGSDVTTTHVSDDELILRAHGFRGSQGCTVAIRLLNRKIPSLESLHLPAAVAAVAERDRGLVIFAGPTGSGKSTSLAALIGQINATSARRVITIEDPVEYRHESKRSLITQREVGRDTSSLAAALLGALRADPDVIVVGEMRDGATMRAALTAAETGHFVLTTVHTGSATQTVERIVDAFAGSEQAHVRSQLAQSLTAVVCQRLLPRKHRPGRRAAVEILLVNDAVRSMIRESRTHLIHNAMTTGRQAGMQTLEHHIDELVSNNEISQEDGRRVIEGVE